jgi:hypothetical protein
MPGKSAARKKHELKKGQKRANVNSTMHLLYFAHPEKTSETLDKPAPIS